MRIIVFLLILFAVNSISAQSRQYYNQYMLNPGMFNPANMDIFTKYGTTVVYHNDYLGSSYAPLSFGVYSYYNRRPHQGIAGSIINDNFGKYNQAEIAANYSYKIFSRNAGGYSHAFGFRVGFTQRYLNTASLYYPTLVKDGVTDPTLGETSIAKFGFNVGFGYAFVTDKWDVNFSMPQLIGNRMPASSVDTLPKRTFKDMIANNNFFLSLGYKHRYDKDWYVFYPTMFIKGAAGAPIHAGIDLNLLMNQLVWTGIGFRSDLTLAGSVGIFLDLGWRFVYSYNSAMLTKHPGTGFSHELSVGYGRTIPENPFQYKKFTTASGDIKLPKSHKIRMPRIKFFKKISGKLKYD